MRVVCRTTSVSSKTVPIRAAEFALLPFDCSLYTPPPLRIVIGRSRYWRRCVMPALWNYRARADCSLPRADHFRFSGSVTCRDAVQRPSPAAPTPPSPLKVSKGQGILPNDTARSGGNTTSRPIRCASATWPSRSRRSSIGCSARRGRRSGLPSRWAFSTPAARRCASITRRKCSERVRGIVERFVGGDTDGACPGRATDTVGSPNWRVRALSLLKPVDVKSPGVEAWLLSRENSAAFYEQLKARADFREHIRRDVEIANGQSQTLARTQPRPYTRGVQLKSRISFLRADYRARSTRAIRCKSAR